MQRRSALILAGLAGGLLLVVLGVFAYVLRPSEAPSGEITAIPVAAETAVPTNTPVEETAPSEAEEADPSDEETTADQPLAEGPQTFEVLQAESEARFIINEVLRGVDTTVVGVTNLVAAQILIDMNDPAATQLGVVTVNARDLTTDEPFRNRAIRNEILDTAKYEFVTFTPTELVGLPASVAVGDSFSFQIVGDLTIRDITTQVTFDATATLESATRFSGSASTTVQRADYNLVIPNVPQVAGVEEQVLLEIDFVAAPSS